MDNKNKKILLGIFYTFFVCGFMALMLGSLIPSLMEEYQVDYDIAGLFLSASSVGSLLASFVVGFFVPKLGQKKTIIIFSPLVFLAYIGVVITNIGFVLIPLFLLVGIGIGSVNNINNFIITDLAEEKPGYISLSHMFFAIGAFISPLLAAFIMRLGFGFKKIIFIGILLSFSMVVVYFKLPIEASSKKIKVQNVENEKPFYKYSTFYIAAFLLFFYLGVEMAVSGFIAAYLTDHLNMDHSFSTKLLSVLWLMIILGRLLSAYLASKFKKTTMLLICSLGASVVFLGFLLTNNPMLITISVIFLGVFLSGIYPMSIASVSNILKQSSKAMGVFLAIVGLGGIFIPMIVGFFAAYFDVMIGMGSILISAALMVFCALLLKIKQRGEM